MLDAAGRRSVGLSLLIALQSFCIVFFVVDVIDDAVEGIVPSLHLVVEGLANLALVAAVAVEVRILRDLLRRQAHANRALSIASGALHDVLDAHYLQWGLTPSEADVATFTIKGCSIAEIARLRGSAEGTVKTHLNAIYRKSGLSGRGQLASLLIEDLLNPAHPGAATGRPAEEAAA
jgi:DNA-binding NarL/FixJ family response regulator